MDDASQIWNLNGFFNLSKHIWTRTVNCPWGINRCFPYAKIGENCRLHQCVTIGRIWPPESVGYNKWIPSDSYPKIGNNVYISPGKIIVGDIEIADGIEIGANSFVNKAVKEKNITIAGNPAKKIQTKVQKNIDFAQQKS